MTRNQSNKKGSKTFRQNLGSFGEQLACEWYLERGYVLVDRNVFVDRIGEIDLIVSRESLDIQEYVFVEVKTRSNQSCGYGYESVDERKLIKMRRCAMQWMFENSRSTGTKSNWRIDVVSIDRGADEFEIQVFSSV